MTAKAAYRHLPQLTVKRVLTYIQTTMDNILYGQAIALQQDGYSIRQIADQLNIGKSSVHRLLNNPPDELEEDGESSPGQASPDSPAKSRNPVDIVAEHIALRSQMRPGTPETRPKAPERDYAAENSAAYFNLERYKLELEDKHRSEENALKRFGAETERLNMDLKAKAISSQLEAERLAAVEKLKAAEVKGNKLVKQYKFLLKEFTAQVEEPEWDRDDWRKFRANCEQVSKDVVQFANLYLKADFESLAIWVNLYTLDRLAEGFIDGYSVWSGYDTVKTKMDDEDTEEFEALTVVTAVSTVVED